MRRRDPAGWDYFVGLGRADHLPPVDPVEGGLGGFFMRALENQELRLVEAVQKSTDKAMESGKICLET
jgi:hypothetical protein